MFVQFMEDIYESFLDKRSKLSRCWTKECKQRVNEEINQLLIQYQEAFKSHYGVEEPELQQELEKVRKEMAGINGGKKSKKNRKSKKMKKRKKTRKSRKYIKGKKSRKH